MSVKKKNCFVCQLPDSLQPAWLTSYLTLGVNRIQSTPLWFKLRIYSFKASHNSNFISSASQMGASTTKLLDTSALSPTLKKYFQPKTANLYCFHEYHLNDWNHIVKVNKLSLSILTLTKHLLAVLASNLNSFKTKIRWKKILFPNTTGFLALQVVSCNAEEH